MQNQLDRIIHEIERKRFNVIALRGTPGSGKTEIANRLHQRLGTMWPVISMDDVAEHLFGEFWKEHDGAIYDRIEAAARLTQHIASEALFLFGHVIIDTTHAWPAHVAATENIAGSKVLWVLACCSNPRVRRERFSSRVEGLSFWEHIHDSIERMLIDGPSTLPCVVIDTATESTLLPHP